MSEPTATPQPSPNGSSDQELAQCPCCFSVRPVNDIAVVKINDKVVINACNQCIARAFSWAATSSLGFILRPVEKSNPGPDKPLDPAESPPQNNSEPSPA